MMSMCIAFQVASTSLVSPVGNLAIVYAIIVDIFIFGVHLGLVEILGCVAVVSITILSGCF